MNPNQTTYSRVTKSNCKLDKRTKTPILCMVLWFSSLFKVKLYICARIEYI